MLVFEAEPAQLYWIWIYDGTTYNFMVNDLHLFDISQQIFFCHTQFISFYHKSNLSLNKYEKVILLVYILSN